MSINYVKITDNSWSYPDWGKIKAKNFLNEEIVGWEMYLDDEMIGFAVLVLNWSDSDMGLENVTYLASFEIKHKRNGWGTMFLKHLISMYETLYLVSVNESNAFYYKNGANILNNGEIYEECLMVISLFKTVGVADYVRDICKKCDMFHFKSEPNDCIPF